MRVKGLAVVRAGMPAVPPLIRDSSPSASTAENGMPVMEVRFSPFGEWYEINSYFEGRFLERTVPGAFKATINAQRQADGSSGVKVLFNHGMDFMIGDKVLGKASDLREGSQSPETLVPLFDTSYNRDLIEGLRAGVYGSSFMCGKPLAAPAGAAAVRVPASAPVRRVRSRCVLGDQRDAALGHVQDPTRRTGAKTVNEIRDREFDAPGGLG
ncbi:HK97 family phage prohead protease [Micromonospora carbonacea]|uniref:HK97 family phage prohead protease n=1 Tax=Micromonospora carbonacea TaxID=47853 RepID=UPI00371A7570